MAEFVETVFLGGGLSCLMAARELGGDSILFERADRVGGLCRSEKLEGFVFDQTGHLLHLRDPVVERRVKELLGKNLQWQARNSWIFSHGVFTRYPFQSHFYGLPPQVIAECLMGVFQAQSRPRRDRQGIANFKSWVLRTFGHGVARHFMFPYNQKLWTVSPQTLTTEWLGRFVPRPNLEKIVLGAVSDFREEEGYNARFYYPRRGGIEELVKALACGVKKVVCGIEVVGIDLRSRQLRLSSGDRIAFGRLVSCAPLPELVKMSHPLPDRVREAARSLRWSSVYNLNLGIRDWGKAARNRHWVYVPEDSYALYRFGYASNFSPAVAPPGTVNLYTEVGYNPRVGLDRKSARERVVRDLKAIGLLRSPKDILVEQENDISYAYATYNRRRSKAVTSILNYFESREVFSIGRYGRWEYSAMEDALLQGMELASKLCR